MGIRPLKVAVPRIYESPTAPFLGAVAARLPVRSDPKVDLRLIAKNAPKPANTPFQLLRSPPGLPANGPGRIGLPGILGVGTAVMGVLEGAYQLYEGWKEQKENDAAVQEIWKTVQIGILQITQTVEQVFSELKELELLRRQSADLQFQIQQLQHIPGYDAEVLRLTQELETLQIQMHAAAKIYPVIGGFFAMVANASNGDPSAADTPAFEMTKQEIEKLAQNNPERLIKLAYEYVAHIKSEVLRLIEEGKDKETITRFYDEHLSQRSSWYSGSIAKIFESNQTDSMHTAIHDYGNQASIISALIRSRISSKERLAVACANPTTSLKHMVNIVRSGFAQSALIYKEGDVTEAVLSPKVPLEKFTALLDNLVRNAAEHPHPERTPITIIIALSGDQLKVIDNGAGMSAETVAHLKNGIRIHDGVPVAEGIRGIGWQSIRKTCREMGATIDIQSQLGQGTTITISFPDGTFLSE